MINNFDIILDQKIRAKQLEISIFQRGNKEFYESIDSMIKTARNELGKIQSVGLERLFNYLAGNIYTNPNITKVQPLISKLLDISALLSPLDYDPASYIKVMKNIIKDSSPLIDTADVQAAAQQYEVATIERAFAETISLYYFLNMLTDSDIIYQSRKYNHVKEVSEGITPQIDNYYPFSRRQLANLIFSQDEDIRGWLSDWMKDLLNHEHTKTTTMVKIRDEIGLN